MSICTDCPEKYYCDDMCPQALAYFDEGEPPKESFTNKNSVVRIVKIKVGD